MSYIKNKGFYKTNVLLLFVVLVLVILISITLGTVGIPISTTVRIIGSKITWIGSKINVESIKETDRFIVMNIRMPRILLAALVGATLSLVGTSYQAMFKNPMADPYVMGVSSGAAFGATIGIVLGMNKGVWGIGLISIMAFIGALATAVIVYQLAIVGNKISTTSILLAGIVMSSLLTAGISIMMIFNHDELENIVLWTMGSFNGASWKGVVVLLIPMIVGVVALIFLSREMNAIQLGEEEAQNLGVKVEKVKKSILVVASLLVACAVSVSGIIGFVGLIVPHLLRLLYGSDHRILLPASFLGGGLFLLICDTLARTMVEGTEIPVGIITAFFGGPFFLYLLKKSQRNKFI